MRRGYVEIRVILVALVYISRAKPHLQISQADWNQHRLFIGWLLPRCKYVDDGPCCLCKFQDHVNLARCYRFVLHRPTTQSLQLFCSQHSGSSILCS
jgi:hypothetical protein